MDLEGTGIVGEVLNTIVPTISHFGLQTNCSVAEMPSEAVQAALLRAKSVAEGSRGGRPVCGNCGLDVGGNVYIYIFESMVCT